MDKNDGLDTFAALSQSTRPDLFRLLIQDEEKAKSAGNISSELGMRENTMSANLGVLARSGLIRYRREGRSNRKFVCMDLMRGRLRFLVEACCGGRSEQCHARLAAPDNPWQSVSARPVYECVGERN
ncbi:MAG: helix-turn-helix domain-containing protein [Rhodobacteraceae bacterium]|nr:helix-turn-helix domain-containing protein [Paracoccaceae bacterium]